MNTPRTTLLLALLVIFGVLFLIEHFQLCKKNSYAAEAYGWGFVILAWVTYTELK